MNKTNSRSLQLSLIFIAVVPFAGVSLARAQAGAAESACDKQACAGYVENDALIEVAPAAIAGMTPRQIVDLGQKIRATAAAYDPKIANRYLRKNYDVLADVIAEIDAKTHDLALSKNSGGSNQTLAQTADDADHATASYQLASQRRALLAVMDGSAYSSAADSPIIKADYCWVCYYWHRWAGDKDCHYVYLAGSCSDYH